MEVSVRMRMNVHVERCLRLRSLVGPRPRASLCACDSANRRNHVTSVNKLQTQTGETKGDYN